MDNLNPISSKIKRPIIIDHRIDIKNFKERIDACLTKIFGKKKIKKILLINPLMQIKAPSILTGHTEKEIVTILLMDY